MGKADENINGELRVSPRHIATLEAGEIFVFGSNAEGMHLGGAARTVHMKFGAVWGNGEGLQGQSYAIPTMEGEESTKRAVERFVEFAQEHPELKFLVTPIGCGIAGYTPEEIAPMFEGSSHAEKRVSPQDFLGGAHGREIGSVNKFLPRKNCDKTVAMVGNFVFM